MRGSSSVTGRESRRRARIGLANAFEQSMYSLKGRLEANGPEKAGFIIDYLT